MLIPSSLVPFQIRIRGISEDLISIPYERCMGKQPSCSFQQGGPQPQQSLCDPPPPPPKAQKYESGFRGLITWQLAPIGRIFAEFGFYLKIRPQEFCLYMVTLLWKNMP